MTNLYKRTSEKTEEELNRDFELYIASKTVNGRYCPTPDLCFDYETECMFSYFCEEPSTDYVEEQNFYETYDSDCDLEIEEYYMNYSINFVISPIPSQTSSCF